MRSSRSAIVRRCLGAAIVIAATLFGSPSVIVTATGIGSWVQTTIGGSQPGSASESLGTWTVSGSGTVYGTSDSLHYVYQQVTGNFEMIANVSACVTTGPYGQECGPMVRASLAGNAANAYCFASTLNYPIYQWRATSGAVTSSAEVGVAHSWYRLSIANNAATCSWSDNGVVWTRLGSPQTLAISGTYYIGMAVASSFPDHIATATIGNVSIAALVQPNAPVSGNDFGGYRPHYQGYGATTPGGRSGNICKVTNVNDAGAGSLRNCVAPRPECVNTPATCARIVVFETSGTIALTAPLYINSPYVTVAGQSAPSPGIGIRNHPVYVDTHDVVLQHLRLRLGDTAYGSNGTTTLYLGIPPGVGNRVYNVVIDHMSLSWGTATTFGVTQWTRDVLVLDSIISEALSKTNNPHGAGNIFYGTTGGTCTIARNLYAHNGNRNPWIGAGFRCSGYNNVLYNPFGVTGDDGTYGFMQIMGTDPNYPASPTGLAWIGNVALPGPDTAADVNPVKISLRADQISGTEVYLADNTGPRMTPANQWSGVTFCRLTSCGILNAATATNVKAVVEPAWHTAFNFQILPAAGVLPAVQASAGARPRDRDSVDARVVDEVTTRQGGVLTSQTLVGGHPSLAINSQTFTTPQNPHSPGGCGATSAGSPRTVIECDLELRARAVEGGPMGAPPAAPRNVRISF